MDRRSYLKEMAGTTGIIAVTGCLGGGDDTEARATDDDGIDGEESDDTTDDTGDPEETEDSTDDTEDSNDVPTGPSQGWPEPGDEPSWSRRLSVGLHGTYLIEDGERHYFNVELNEGDELTATMYFNHDDGDLNLEVLDPDENQVGSSTSDSDDESVTVQAREMDANTRSEVYYVVPYGSSGVTNEYDIEIEID
ncbi:hypothetical protein [Halovivax gelatinilyticus]|uniref:hypothetical protein n=1 Tax=Halovivax gelatinilyticus TaxID=2961597 RepID=UPI0020CA8283|nr:hypothetical protein [Halovivax gelatinilyticus]